MGRFKGQKDIAPRWVTPRHWPISTQKAGAQPKDLNEIMATGHRSNINRALRRRGLPTLTKLLKVPRWANGPRHWPLSLFGPVVTGSGQRGPLAGSEAALRAGRAAAAKNKGRERTPAELAQLEQLHRNFTSKPERFIKAAFEAAGLTFIHQGSIPGLKTPGHRGHHQFDFLFPTLKVAVEFDGKYWHSPANPNWDPNREAYILAEATRLDWKIIRIKDSDVCVKRDPVTWRVPPIPEVGFNG